MYVEYDQEIPQSHTTYQPKSSCGNHTGHLQQQNSRKTIKVSNQLFLPQQDDCESRNEVLHNKNKIQTQNWNKNKRQNNWTTILEWTAAECNGGGVDYQILYQDGCDTFTINGHNTLYHKMMTKNAIVTWNNTNRNAALELIAA